MLKQILLLSMIMVLVKSQNNNKDLHTDEYINYNRREYDANVQRFDLRLDTFKQIYAGQINTIHIQRGMLTDGLLQNDEYLNALAFLSDTNKRCIAQYRPLIPTIVSVKKALDACASEATSQMNNLLVGAISTRNSLQSYYTNTFEKYIAICKETYAKDELKYVSCAKSETETANTYTINNRKIFATQMDANDCSADGIIKRALDYSFSVHNSTIILTAKANTLINGCMQGLECIKCYKF